MFRRRRQADDAGELEADDVDLDIDESDEDEDDTDRGGDDAGGVQAGGGGPASRAEGPWDSDEVDGDPTQGRVDLGGLLVPVDEGVELRVDVSAEGQLMAATLVQGASAMQVNAFAAPRTAGIWDEVRAEILESLAAGGGSAEEATGTFGRELHARVPGEVPGQGRVLQPARFIGVDGPRWFLRALISGPAATDPVQAQHLEALFRGIVVVRGKEAMAPRDLIPLRLPKEVAEAAAAQAAQEQGAPRSADDLNPFERGPEITEIR